MDGGRLLLAPAAPAVCVGPPVARGSGDPYRDLEPVA
jgi:hypothetical protein